MCRRSTPEHLDTARRAAALARPISNGELPIRADAWLLRWERQAALDGRGRGSAYWEAGYRWVASQRNGPPPPV